MEQFVPESNLQTVQNTTECNTKPSGSDADVGLGLPSGVILDIPSASMNVQGTTKPVNVLSSDEKAGDSCDNSSKKPKGKKRKKTPRDTTAPRQPLTGYVRFLNDRREKVRADNPGLPFAELTKLMAVEWSQLTPEHKKHYLDAAELDRERYAQEMSAYKLTEAYKIFTQKQLEKQLPEIKHPALANMDSERESSLFPSLEIPIFTEEFLDHNKSREAELRQLRKSNIDFEQQNSILEKHIEQMRAAVDKLEGEANQARLNNTTLLAHLHDLRGSLTASFAAVPLPGSFETPTLATVDSYMSKLDALLQDPNTANRDALAGQVRELVGRLEFHA